MSLLNIGTRSLTAAQGTLTTISHNIANANTAGYTRQEAVLSTAGGSFSGSGFFGRGVDLTTVRRLYDQFLTGAVHAGAAQSAEAAARADALAGLDSLFTDPQLGVGAALDSLFAATGDLANRPSDMAARQAFLSRTMQLVERFNSLGTQLTEQGRLAEGRITSGATQVNARLTEIRTLNTRIAEAQAAGAHAPNDLLDQRDVALEALNGLMAVRAVPVADGTVNLFTASGAALLVGSQQARMDAVRDPADASRVALQLVIGGVAQPIDAAGLGGGSLAGQLRFRDEDLPAVVNQLGRIATVMTERFNAQQMLGVDANGAQGTALFTLPPMRGVPHSANGGSAAMTLTVADPSQLQPSDYRVDWDGSAYTITRLSDGQATSAASLPATIDGLRLSASGAPAAGDSWTLRPFAAAASDISARALSPQQLATGFAAMAEASAGNLGSATASRFQVTRASADNTLPVTITFNDPPTSFNVIGLAGGDLMGVPYAPGTRVPAAPADYNGWSLVLDGAPKAGDNFQIRQTSSPRSDNRNALALGALADLRGADGATLNESYASLLGDAGVRVQSARDLADVTHHLQAEAVSRQQAGAGVNLDEEAANLLRYQQAYQASAKIIQASQSLFEALLAATGR